MFTRALAGVVLLGAGARLAHYLANRSLWLDEAMVALNIGQRSFVELVGRLDFNQAAPLGFLWLEKAAVIALGFGERSLRLFPLLASLGALVVFALLVRRVLRPLAALGVVCVLALSASQVYYAAEVKQYAFDVLCASILLLVPLLSPGLARPGPRPSHPGPPPSHPTPSSSQPEPSMSNPPPTAPIGRGGEREPAWKTLGLVGALAVWFSHPAVFLLPGVAVYALTAPGERRARWRPLLAVGLLWAVSFAAAYLSTARGASASPVMARFWVDGFMPLLPTSREQLAWFPEAAAGWIRSTIDFSETESGVRTTAIWLGGLLAAFGIAAGRREPRALALVGFPIALALFASALRAYPFQGRLILFLVPSTLLLIGWGLEAVEDVVGRRAGGLGRPLAVALAGALALCAAVILAGWLGSPGREELRPVLRAVAERADAEDVVYLHSGAQHAHLYYERSCPPCRIDARPVRGAFPLEDETAIEDELRRLPGSGRVWMIFSHVWWGYGDIERRLLVDRLGERAIAVDSIIAVGARAYAFDLGPRLGAP